MLTITAICNAGILIKRGQESILIDGIARSHLGFNGLDPSQFEDLLHRRGLFADLKAVLFTHCHPDHYDPQRVSQVRQMRPELPLYIPDSHIKSNGCIQCGGFSVYYMETPHMPHTFEQVRHFVFLVEAGSETVYLAADAVMDAALHRSILDGRKPDCIIVNPVYLTDPDIRSWLSEADPGRIIVYHVPVDAMDKTGMHRKAERSIARYQSFLPPMLLPDRFPLRMIEKE